MFHSHSHFIILVTGNAVNTKIKWTINHFHVTDTGKTYLCSIKWVLCSPFLDSVNWWSTDIVHQKICSNRSTFFFFLIGWSQYLTELLKAFRLGHVSLPFDPTDCWERITWLHLHNVNMDSLFIVEQMEPL